MVPKRGPACAGGGRHTRGCWRCSVLANDHGREAGEDVGLFLYEKKWVWRIERTECGGLAGAYACCAQLEKETTNVHGE